MRKKRCIFWLLLSGIIVWLDRLTKMWALSLPYNQPDNWLGSWVRWRLAFNKGIAFSIGHGLQGLFPCFLLLLNMILTTLLFVWLLTLCGAQKSRAAAVALILGGAIGNLWDRIYYGYVIDFIDMGFYHWRFPTYNVADLCISLGVFWLCCQMVKK